MQELNDLQSQIKDTSVIVEVNNGRNLNLDGIVAEVKSQYEAIANASRKDAEEWYEVKVSAHTEETPGGRTLAVLRHSEKTN